MTIDEIKAAVDVGNAVRWSNDTYRVGKDDLGQYQVTCITNGSTIGLTNKAGTNLNGEGREFYIAGEAEVWENLYWCGCGENWTEEADSQCEDRCPVCNSPTVPLISSLVCR